MCDIEFFGNSETDTNLIHVSEFLQLSRQLNIMFQCVRRVLRGSTLSRSVVLFVNGDTRWRKRSRDWSQPEKQAMIEHLYLRHLLPGGPKRSTYTLLDEKVVKDPLCNFETLRTSLRRTSPSGVSTRPLFPHCPRDSSGMGGGGLICTT